MACMLNPEFLVGHPTEPTAFPPPDLIGSRFEWLDPVQATCNSVQLSWMQGLGADRFDYSIGDSPQL